MHVLLQSEMLTHISCLVFGRCRWATRASARGWRRWRGGAPPGTRTSPLPSSCRCARGARFCHAPYHGHTCQRCGCPS